MGISRRDFFKVCGGAALATGLPHWTLGSARGSTGPEVDVYAFICGILKTQTQYILKDTRVGVPFDIPVPFFLIRHGREWVAFDTGNNGQVAKNAEEYWGEAIVRAYTPVMQPYEEFKEQIKMLGLTPKDLSCVVVSHGHLDHAGAIDNFVGTRVPIYFQKVELDWINKMITSKNPGAYIAADFKQMNKLNIQPLSGVFDLFGDGSMVVFPSPGHTPGHQSLLVNTRGGRSLILTQDACYTLENMTASIPMGLAWDIPQALQGLSVFRTMTYMGAGIVPPHDPSFWKNKPLAPQTLRI